MITYQDGEWYYNGERVIDTVGGSGAVLLNLGNGESVLVGTGEIVDTFFGHIDNALIQGGVWKKVE